MRIATILDPSCVVLDVGRGTTTEVLGRLATPICTLRTDLDCKAILEELVHRERESSTAIADGIAIPHARPDCRDLVTASFGRSREGVDFESLDGQPTRLIVVLVSPASNPPLHVAWLSHVARLLSDRATRARLLDAETPGEILDVLADRESALQIEQAGRTKVAG